MKGHVQESFFADANLSSLLDYGYILDHIPTYLDLFDNDVDHKAKDGDREPKKRQEDPVLCVSPEENMAPPSQPV